MTLEVAHFQMFETALGELQPIFPPGILQGDPRYSNKYFKMSGGNGARGPWNQGMSKGLNEEWDFIDNTEEHVKKTNGLIDEEIKGTKRTIETAKSLGEQLSAERSKEIKKAINQKENSWGPH